MDVTSIAKLATSMAETGNRQEVQAAVMKRAMQIEGSVATQLIDAIKTAQPAQRLPSNLGNNINTTA